MNAAFGNNAIQWSIVGTSDGSESILALVPGHDPLYAHSAGNANYQEIKRLLTEGNPGDVDRFVTLFDVAKGVADKFVGPLSERVAVRHGRIYVDGDEMDDVLTRQIIRYVVEGGDDWKPLVAFFEKVLVNPLPEAREHLYEWMRRHRITITTEGDLVLYKGVRIERTDSDGEVFTPTTAGKGVVNDTVENEAGTYTEFRVGDIVSIERSAIAYTPHAPCGTGLHVGTRSFASMYGPVLRVIVNPRDVVNVPNAENKLRCCRYKVLDRIDGDRREWTAEDEPDVLLVEVPSDNPGPVEPEDPPAEP